MILTPGNRVAQIAIGPQTKNKTCKCHLKEADIVVDLRKLLAKQLNRLLK